MITAIKVLVCDDDEALCYLLKEQLVEKNFSVDTVYDGKYAIENIKKKTYDLVLLDLNMQIVSGEEVLRFIKENYPSLQVIILTADSEIRKAIDCIKLGAYDFLTKPYNFDDLFVTINRAIEHKELLIKNELLTKQASNIKSSSIIGDSQALKQLMTLAAKAASSDSSILIEGETGTGKELLAEFIHKNSVRHDKAFVAINCASLPDQLIESELFGYEKGAFTDAKTSKQGLVEFANGGTLFLDEIGEMSLNIQPKLLRFLENGEYRRVGGVNTFTSNVRIIVATNRNLMEEIEKKNFRRDLLFRLNVITLTVPPLRNRKEDIVTLAQHFLKVKSPIRSPKNLSEKAVNALVNYYFPGNIRELEHIIERAIIFSDDNLIKLENLFLPSS
ncbi:MAG: sigma-54 dependent transcriptional regulator, partial [Ignavibacteriaceae bacterium]|nr:sigma-54 dependent transcriptional regulator [Ignavibacteriaceae bacterium]